MKHLGLFEGIGGFSLAARWMNWETLAWVEKDAYCQKVLQKHFPKAKAFSDIKNFDAHEFKNKIDIITGGFPCQPFSIAGERKGTDDERYLWKEMFRVICQVQPTFIVGENVVGLLSMDGGKTFESICLDLESQGYAVQTFIIPACSVGAWHIRNRVWIIAHNSSFRQQRQTKENRQGICNQKQNNTNAKQTREKQQRRFEGHTKIPSNTISNGIHRHKPKAIQELSPLSWSENIRSIEELFRRPNAPEPLLRRGTHGIPNRVDRIRALGNAIVPQVAYQIFKHIEHNYLPL